MAHILICKAQGAKVAMAQDPTDCQPWPVDAIQELGGPGPLPPGPAEVRLVGTVYDDAQDVSQVAAGPSVRPEDSSIKILELVMCSEVPGSLHPSSTGICSVLT